MPESSSNVISIEEKRSAYVVTANVDLIRTISGTLGYAAAGLYSVLDTYCNSDKQAWPSEATLAETGRMSVKQVRRLLNELVATGWVLREPRRNQFGWANGYLYTLPHHMTPSRKTGDMDGTSPGQCTGHDISPNDPRGNTKVDTKVSPSKNPPTPLPEHGPAQQIVKVWCEEVGLERPTDYRRAVGQAQHLVKAGLSPEDARDLIRWIRRQEWVTSSLDLGLMYKLADKWRTDPKRVAAAPKPELTQADLRQKQYIDWKPGTFQNLDEWYDRRDNGTLPVKGLLR